MGDRIQQLLDDVQVKLDELVMAIQSPPAEEPPPDKHVILTDLEKLVADVRERLDALTGDDDLSQATGE